MSHRITAHTSFFEGVRLKKVLTPVLMNPTSHLDVMQKVHRKTLTELVLKSGARDDALISGPFFTVHVLLLLHCFLSWTRFPKKELLWHVPCIFHQIPYERLHNVQKKAFCLCNKIKMIDSLKGKKKIKYLEKLNNLW